MAGMTLECPRCAARLKVAAHLAGARLRCGRCGAPFIAPPAGEIDLGALSAAAPASAFGGQSPQPRRRAMAWRKLGLAAAIALGVCCVLATMDDVRSGGRPDEVIVFRRATDFAAPFLKAPATARWPASGRVTELIRPEPRRIVWRVDTYVDSQNSFGALIRSPVVALVSYREADVTWRLEGLAIDGRLLHFAGTLPAAYRLHLARPAPR